MGELGGSADVGGAPDDAADGTWATSTSGLDGPMASRIAMNTSTKAATAPASPIRIYRNRLDEPEERPIGGSVVPSDESRGLPEPAALDTESQSPGASKGLDSGLSAGWGRLAGRGAAGGAASAPDATPSHRPGTSRMLPLAPGFGGGDPGVLAGGAVRCGLEGCPPAGCLALVRGWTPDAPGKGRGAGPVVVRGGEPETLGVAAGGLDGTPPEAPESRWLEGLGSAGFTVGWLTGFAG